MRSKPRPDGRAWLHAADGSYCLNCSGLMDHRTSPEGEPSSPILVAAKGRANQTKLHPARRTPLNSTSDRSFGLDGKHYAHAFSRKLSELYAVDGLR